MTADSKELEDVWRCVTGVALGNHLERDIFELYRGLGPEIAAFKADLRLLLSTNEALARENAEALTVMKQAEGWFLDYAKQHTDKQTREGFEKADTNRVRANALRAVINRLEPSHDQ